MRTILEHIKRRKAAFSELPLFHFMRDRGVAPAQRLALAPCMAHYVMTFADMNEYVLREPSTRDELQRLVNIHTEEDASHWQWFVRDLQKLGLNGTHAFGDTLEFLWGDATVKSRLLSYRMCGLILPARPLLRLVICECVEATGNVFLGAAAQIGRELHEAGGASCVYFGAHHYGCESGHTMGTADIEARLDALALSAGERLECLTLADVVFELYTEFVGELHAYARKNSIHALRSGALDGGAERLKTVVVRAV